MKILTIFLFILFSCTLRAQNYNGQIANPLPDAFPVAHSIINRINTLDSLSFAAAATYPHEGIKYGQQMLLLSEQLGLGQSIATAYSDIGVNYGELSDFQHALNYDFKALEWCTNAGNKKGIACNLVNIGLVYLAQADFSRALSYFYRGLRIYEGLADQKNIAACLNNVGNVYLVQKNYPKATQNYEQALKKYQELHDSEHTAICLGNLGIISKEQYQYNKALEYHMQALAALKNLNNKNTLLINLSDIGIIYRHLNNYNKALEYLFMALDISRELDSKDKIAINLGYIGETYFAIGSNNSDTVKATALIRKGSKRNFITAVDFLQRAIDLCKSAHLSGQLIEFNQYLSDAYFHLGNYQKAYEALKNKIAIADSVFSPQKAAEVKDIETQRAVELKNKQILIDKLGIKLKQHNIFIYILTTGTLILIIIITANYLYVYKKSNISLTKENKQTFNLLLEAQLLANVGSWNVDVGKNEIFWSEGTRLIYGVDEHFKPSFEAFISMIHPEDRSEIVAQITKGRETGATIKSIFRIIRSDGAIRVLNNITKFELDKDGKAIRIYGTSHDISELNLVEETLRKSEANIKTIFDNTDTGYILIDSALNIISFNRPAQQRVQKELLSYLIEGNNILDCFTTKEQPILSKVFDRVLAGESINFESKFVSNNVTEKWYAFQYIPVVFSSKNISGIVVSITDITELKKTEQLTKALVDNLQKKNNDLNQFAYIISHNLRAPIVNILGLAELFNSKNEFKDNKIIVDYITDEVSRLDSVIKDLNDILTIRDVQHTINDIVVFEDKLKRITDVLKQEIEQSGATIVTHFGVTKIATIKGYLYSILYNLISNAIKYRSPFRPLQIYVETKEENDMIKLSVQDNGIGIDLNKNGDKIFGLYNRFNSNNIEGKGLGLYLVKTEVEVLGGYLQLETTLDKGTIFHIYLPKH